MFNNRSLFRSSFRIFEFIFTGFFMMYKVVLTVEIFFVLLFVEFEFSWLMIYMLRVNWYIFIFFSGTRFYGGTLRCWIDRRWRGAYRHLYVYKYICLLNLNQRRERGLNSMNKFVCSIGGLGFRGGFFTPATSKKRVRGHKNMGTTGVFTRYFWRLCCVHSVHVDEIYPHIEKIK